MIEKEFFARDKPSTLELAKKANELRLEKEAPLREIEAYNKDLYVQSGLKQRK